MNTQFFIDELAEVFPGRPLSGPQQVVYREKLMRFSDRDRQLIYDALLETCKYFPKIADIYEAALELGLLNEKFEYTPHVWKPTECGLCGGYGLMAAFWDQEFKLGDSSKLQILKLANVMPYHQSSPRYFEKPDEVRSVYRCACLAGELPTIEKGLPRWSKDHALEMVRPW